MKQVEIELTFTDWGLRGTLVLPMQSRDTHQGQHKRIHLCSYLNCVQLNPNILIVSENVSKKCLKSGKARLGLKYGKVRQRNVYGKPISKMCQAQAIEWN